MTSFTETPKGIIFDIERSSMYDGPGIRTTVFLKGCPLSCKWCHNPESQKKQPQLAFFQEKCINCQMCRHACPSNVHTFDSCIDSDFLLIHDVSYAQCIQCGKCVNACPSSALKIYGQSAAVDDVMNVVRKDKPYYQATNGGLTVSGGEPFVQYDFLLSLLKQAKSENISTCIETSGFVSREILTKIMPYVDIFLFDYKETDPELHKAYTGVDNSLILENLDFLYHQQKKIILRCPIIPGYNDTPEHFKGISSLERKYPDLKGIEIMPYHDLGKTKAMAIGNKYVVSEPTADRDLIQKWKNTMLSCGCSKQILDSF